MLEENDIFSLKYLNSSDQKYDQECKNMIYYVIENKRIDAEGLLKAYGQKTSERYMTLCNTYRKEKEDKERQAFCDKLRVKFNKQLSLNEDLLDISVIVNDCNNVIKLNKWLDYMADKPMFTDNIKKEFSRLVYKKLGRSE